MALFLSLTQKNYLFYRQAQEFQSNLRVPQCYHICKFTTRCQPDYQAYICFRLGNKLETLKIAGLPQRERPIKIPSQQPPLLLELDTKHPSAHEKRRKRRQATVWPKITKTSAGLTAVLCPQAQHGELWPPLLGAVKLLNDHSCCWSLEYENLLLFAAA